MADQSGVNVDDAVLLQCNHESIPMFSFRKEEPYRALVVKVYDGDTVRLVFNFRGVLTKINTRLVGIDAPEIRSSSEQERIAAVKSRDYLAQLIMGKIVNAYLGDCDKYGRPLATIYIDGGSDVGGSGVGGSGVGGGSGGMSVSDMMIASGYAYAYTGGKKQEFVE